MIRLLWLITFIFYPFTHQAQTPTLVRDINTGSADGFFSTVSQPAVMNDLFYFAATEPLNGPELWRSDGTESGTYLVKDINPGTAGSFPINLTNVNGILYFYATNSLTGRELWRSDGTQQGTYLVKDIAAGTDDSVSPYPLLTNVNGTLYFQAFVSGSSVTGLWRSDGTETGTTPVEYAGPRLGRADEMAAVNGTLFFVTSVQGAGPAPNSGVELYAVDSTTRTVYLVKDIFQGTQGSSPSHLTRAGNLLYFLARDNSHSYELWRSDGTAAGTRMVRQLLPSGNSNSGEERFNNFTDVDGTLFFTFTDNNTGNELWRSDGTENGTYLVKDINPGTAGSNPKFITNTNGIVSFNAFTQEQGYELWRSDGTATGTHLVKDINPGTLDSYPQNLASVSNTLYFSASQETTGYELWRSDGTAGGTNLVYDINPGNGGSKLNYMTNVNGNLFFRANDGIHGDELWVVDNRPGSHQCNSLTSGNWTSPSTWSCGREPTRADVVIIKPGHTVTISTTSAQAQRIIYSGGIITFSAGATKLVVEVND